MKVSKESSVMSIKIRGQEIEQVKQFKYLGCTLTEDTKCTKQIRSRIAMACKRSVQQTQGATNQGIEQRPQGRNNQDGSAWSLLLYGAETWTLKQEDIIRLEACEMWFWRRMMKISWIERITNEEVPRRGHSSKPFGEGRTPGLDTSSDTTTC